MTSIVEDAIDSFGAIFIAVTVSEAFQYLKLYYVLPVLSNKLFIHVNMSI